ncbi:hypothetical protein PENSPDRAFT_247381 [Peniophora sp. CONT]|nr:hypothetical protein PENSPDRAFT_247381 [Peniophora sp. CONT]
MLFCTTCRHPMNAKDCICSFLDSPRSAVLPSLHLLPLECALGNQGPPATSAGKDNGPDQADLNTAGFPHRERTCTGAPPRSSGCAQPARLIKPSKRSPAHRRNAPTMLATTNVYFSPSSRVPSRPSCKSRRRAMRTAYAIHYTTLRSRRFHPLRIHLLPVAGGKPGGSA